MVKGEERREERAGTDKGSKESRETPKKTKKRREHAVDKRVEESETNKKRRTRATPDLDEIVHHGVEEAVAAFGAEIAPAVERLRADIAPAAERLQAKLAEVKVEYKAEALKHVCTGMSALLTTLERAGQ